MQRLESTTGIVDTVFLTVSLSQGDVDDPGDIEQIREFVDNDPQLNLDVVGRYTVPVFGISAGFGF